MFKVKIVISRAISFKSTVKSFQNENGPFPYSLKMFTLKYLQLQVAKTIWRQLVGTKQFSRDLTQLCSFNTGVVDKISFLRKLEGLNRKWKFHGSFR